jgi:prepilin-type N-terminal cleavage/methylation domain-containing protein
MRTSTKGAARGFTLLELIIVIAILAILSVAVILVINPAETLARARDSQRLSDLAAMKSAIGLYLAEVVTSHLANGTDASCLGDSGGANTSALVFYSAPTTPVDVADATNPADVGTEAPMGADWVNSNAWAAQVVAANVGLTNGTGWLPVNISAIASGSPLSNWPVDPVNTVSADPITTDLVYRYACDQSDRTFEIDARMESTRYSAQHTSDGGDNSNVFEVGTTVRLLPTGTDF